MTDERYTHGHSDSVLRSHRSRTAANSSGYLLSHLRPEMSLLDVGCGPGTITVELAARVAPGRVVGLDASSEVIDEARRGPGGALVDWQQGSVYELAFDDGTFDVVHAHQVLQHLGDPVRALEEMRRVCAPGGVIAARDSDYGAWTWYPEELMMDAWRGVYNVVARANGGEPNAGRSLLAWAHAAGLRNVETSVTAWCYTAEHGAPWWAAIWADRIVESEMAAQAVEIGAATPDELRDMAAGWRRWGEHSDAWLSIPSTEILCRLPEPSASTGSDGGLKQGSDGP